jgi:hypothetical protein
MKWMSVVQSDNATEPYPARLPDGIPARAVDYMAEHEDSLELIAAGGPLLEQVI